MIISTSATMAMGVRGDSRILHKYWKHLSHILQQEVECWFQFKCSEEISDDSTNGSWDVVANL